MSAFEDYSRSAANYDTTRGAIGVEVILGVLAASGNAISRMTVLDAGCGTGNYARALEQHGARVIGLDLNPAMLGIARGKLEQPLLARANLCQLPLANDAVDAAMVNQVLHHLPDSAVDGWQLRAQVFTELARVVRPGGVVVVNTCSQRQIRQGWWYFSLIPEAVDRVCSRYLPLGIMEDMLRGAGLAPRGRTVPVDALVQGEHYFDTTGPERDDWRDGDSTWAEVSAPALEAALERLRGMRARGTLEGCIEAHERTRRAIGQITFVHAVRVAS
jgi:ubiquinone/menaquinone biosynthesis C-methylase UbiE